MIHIYVFVEVIKRLRLFFSAVTSVKGLFSSSGFRVIKKIQNWSAQWVEDMQNNHFTLTTKHDFSVASYLSHCIFSSVFGYICLAIIGDSKLCTALLSISFSNCTTLFSARLASWRWELVERDWKELQWFCRYLCCNVCVHLISRKLISHF